MNGEIDYGNIRYVFDEDKYLKEIKDAIDSTYNAHYAQNKVQSTEFINDAGHGEGFCIGNIIKYAQRYGKKRGYNRDDLTKIIHYAIIMLHLHDNYYKRDIPKIDLLVTKEKNDGN